MTKRRQSTPIVPDRVRTPGTGGFAFVPNRFLRGGFFAALSPDELLLYFLLVLAANRQGVSFYHYDTLCALLRWPVERYLQVRNRLIETELVAFDGTRFQVLTLPANAPPQTKALTSQDDFEEHDPATIRTLIEDSLSHRE